MHLTEEQWDELYNLLNEKNLEDIVDSADERTASSTVSAYSAAVIHTFHQYLDQHQIPRTSEPVIARYAKEWIRDVYQRAQGK